MRCRRSPRSLSSHSYHCSGFSEYISLRMRMKHFKKNASHVPEFWGFPHGDKQEKQVKIRYLKISWLNVMQLIWKGLMLLEKHWTRLEKRNTRNVLECVGWAHQHRFHPLLFACLQPPTVGLERSTETFCPSEGAKTRWSWMGKARVIPKGGKSKVISSEAAK